MQFPLQLRRLNTPPSHLHYCVQQTAFGLLLSQWINETSQAWLCGQQFFTQAQALEQLLQQSWPESQWQESPCPDPRWQQALQTDHQVSFEALPIAVYGSDFQWQVWQALITIPFATTCCYQDIAQQIQNPRAVRAVATAIGQNPVAYLIPCHRVLRHNGDLGGYRWGTTLKQQLLHWEQTHISESLTFPSDS